MPQVAHLTSVHPRHDTRIFLKECRSLARAGYRVLLVVADGLGGEDRDGVHFVDVGKLRGRVRRMTETTRRIAAQAIRLDADIYHLHDPELLPVALYLNWQGRRVIYDAHEDLPAQVLSKPYLRPVLRRPIAAAVGHFENFVCRKLGHVVAATPAIRDKFVRAGIRAIDVNNFPMLGELETDVEWSGKAREVCYVGGITAVRGIGQVVAAIALCKSGVRLNVGGRFSEQSTREAVGRSPGWRGVNELGFLSRQEMRSVLGRSVAGIVTFLPEPNHLNAQPNKMFEYMSAGLPVIASNFPLWREIIEGNDCGLCVDPLDPRAIADAIDHLVENPDVARRMGENGRRAVVERYNWAVEEKKLLALYEQLLASRELGPTASGTQ